MLAIHAMKAVEPVVAGTLRMATSAFVYLVVVLPLVGGLGVLGSAFGSASLWLVLGASAAGAASYLTYYAANHLVGASRAMPINSLYAVWAIVFSIVLTGLHPTVAARRRGADHLRRRGLVVSGAPKMDGDLDERRGHLPAGGALSAPHDRTPWRPQATGAALRGRARRLPRRRLASRA